MAGLVVVELGVGEGQAVAVPLVDLDDPEGVELDRTVSTSSVFERLDVEELLAPVRSMGAQVRDSLGELKPDSVKFEVGVAAGVKNGKVVALLVEGKADVSMKLTLEWDLSDR